MKKMMRIMVGMLALFMLVGCSPEKDNTTNSSAQESAVKKEETTVSVSISVDGEEVSSKEIAFKEGDFLQELMNKNFEVKEDNGFITTIEGHEQDTATNKYWLFFVNDETPDVGAAEYQLKANDKVVWKLEELDME